MIHVLNASSPLASLALRNQNIRVLSLQVPGSDQSHDVSSATSVKLCTKSRLSEPRRDGSSNNGERLEDLVNVVVVGVLWRILVGVEVGRGESPLRVGSGGS